MTAQRKTAVLTGGLGYVGRHVAQCLLGQGWELVLLVRAGSRDQVPATLSVARMFEYDGSLASLDALEVAGGRVVFFHLAASVELKDETAACDRLVNSNVRFGAHLLSYMDRHDVDKLVAAESYWQFDSSGALGGNSLYAVSKSAFSLLLEYACRRSIRATALVLYDVYGPNDERGKLLDLLVKHAVAQQAIDLTAGEQVVDFVHVQDVARAFAVAGEALLEGRNDAAFERRTVRSMRSGRLRDFVDILGQVMGKAPPVRWGARPYPAHQIMQPWLPPASLQLPGWEPTISFEAGVQGLLDHA